MMPPFASANSAQPGIVVGPTVRVALAARPVGRRRGAGQFSVVAVAFWRRGGSCVDPEDWTREVPLAEL
jgi:hypothetical protein